MKPLVLRLASICSAYRDRDRSIKRVVRVCGQQYAIAAKIMADNWEDDAATAPAGRNETLRSQLKRIDLSEKTLKMFETDEVDLQLLLDLDAESLAEVEFQDGERERLVEWLKAVKALKKRCAELDKAIP